LTFYCFWQIIQVGFGGAQLIQKSETEYGRRSAGWQMFTIGQIRKKIEIDATQPLLIKNGARGWL